MSLKNIVVVLYQPQDIVNVGGVVRVMSNFGLSRLRLVEPAAYDPYRIEGIAHHTTKIAEAIERFPSLEEALADCGFVLGTTARKRGTLREHLTPRQAGPYLFQYASTNPETPTALLFGREDDGLPNEALDLCHALVTVPTDPTNSSLNLAQAALVIAYELWSATHPPEHPQIIPAEPRPLGAPPRWGDLPSSLEALEAALAEDEQLANGSDREEMFAALTRMLRALHPDSTDLKMTYSMARLRAILLRAAPRREESRLLAHLFQHITRRVQPKEKRV
ncbi:MAG: TrmH family RNA methyltransferase [Chloroflexota bacterium]|nr:hypothetical protein [Chloroflexota bacterium]